MEKSKSHTWHTNVRPTRCPFLNHCWPKVADIRHHWANVAPSDNVSARTIQQRLIHKMLCQCCTTVCDVEPAVSEYWTNISWLLGCYVHDWVHVIYDWGPRKTKRRPDSCLLLRHHLRRWANSNPELRQRMVLSGVFKVAQPFSTRQIYCYIKRWGEVGVQWTGEKWGV